METKTCTKCKITKTIENFTFKNTKQNKRHSSCSECTRKAVNKNYLDKTDYYKYKANINNKSYRIRNLQFTMDYLKTHPCVDCNESDPIVLEFDHLHSKKKGVSQMVSAAHSIKDIELEISKCEVRCCNCHRRKTAKQFNWYKKIEL